MPEMITWDVLLGLPPYGPPALPFSATGQGTHQEGFVVRFHPPGTDPWIGNFQRGSSACEAVMPHPDGRHVLVVAGGEGYVIDPESRLLHYCLLGDISAILEVPVLGLLVFTNGIWVETIGADGQGWRTPRISWDGIRKLRCDGHIVRGEAYTPLGDHWLPFELDLITHAVEGGSYNGPPM